MRCTASCAAFIAHFFPSPSFLRRPCPGAGKPDGSWFHPDFNPASLTSFHDETLAFHIATSLNIAAQKNIAPFHPKPFTHKASTTFTMQQKNNDFLTKRLSFIFLKTNLIPSLDEISLVSVITT
jgi:hypothetical protein